MSEASRREIRAGLELCLARVWRYALILSRANDTADDLAGDVPARRYAEAAGALGIPIGTVMSRLATARSALASLK